MSTGFKSLFRVDDIPDWFLILCVLISLPILAYPLALYFSIFLFDSPNSSGLEVLYFLLIVSYPFILLANALLSFHFYRKSKIFGVLILLIPLAFYAVMGIYFNNI
jgi:hypothetical protein